MAARDGAQEYRSQLAKRYPLTTHELTLAGRDWSIAAVSDQDALLATVQTDQDLELFPYGLLLWASAVGLAEWLSEEEASLAGCRTLELGCGAGLPGLVAQHLRADVAQTDYQPEALNLARWNAFSNDIKGIDQWIGDWRDFPQVAPFDLVMGSDLLYEHSLHTPLASLLPRLLAPGGKLMLSDPIRPQALVFMEALERNGWKTALESRLILWEGAQKEIALFSAFAPR